MNTDDFFRRVLPETGWYALVTISDEGVPAQRWYQSKEELSRAALMLDSSGKNTYFAVNSFKERGSRKQINVEACRSLYIDIDCGPDKPYPDQKGGLRALQQFLKDTALPTPMIVSSGRGLHIYWTFERDVLPSEWQALANALKRLTVQHGFEVDPSRTADSASILRPVGTTNPKNGAAVEMWSVGHTTTYDTLRALLNPSVSQPTTPRKTTLLDNLAVKPEFPPGNADVIQEKCQQINWIVTNQGEVSEPLWYAMLGVAAHTQNPEMTAIHWSDQHPGYDEGRTLSKMQQWQRATGPSLCERFIQLNPEKCKGCVFRERVKTPVQLGLQYEEAPPPEDIPIDPATIPHMPEPFKRTAAGIKITVNGVDLDVCKFDVVPVGYGYDEGLGYETVRYLWNRQHVGWTELKMRQAYLTDGHRDFPTVIADQGIVLYNKKQTESFQLMLRSYMEELKKQQTLTNNHNTMGWREDYSKFILGSKIMTRQFDGTIETKQSYMSARSSKVAEGMYTSQGHIDDWSEFTKVLDKLQLDGHKFALGVSFSAALYDFTGLKGLTVSLYGPTGSGKTISQLHAQSIWGNPDELHFTAKFTHNALFDRMALYKNLPFTIDEATIMDAKDVGEFLYWVTQGRDKARLNRHAETIAVRTWSLPVIVSTNRSLSSALFVQSQASDAQAARLLELTVEPVKAFTQSPDIGRKMYQAIHSTYGVAGEIFIRHLLKLGPQAVRDRITKAFAEFGTKYGVNFTGSERYWETGVVLADLASEMASELGLIKYDWTTGTRFALGQIPTMRTTVSGVRYDMFDLLGEYINSHANMQVTVMHTDQTKPQMDYNKVPNGAIRVRYDLFRKDVSAPFTSGTLTIDRTHFREWLSIRGADFKMFMSDLTAEGINVTPATGKASMGKHTSIKVPQCSVVSINLSHTKLSHLITNDDDGSDTLLGKLKVVK